MSVTNAQKPWVAKSFATFVLLPFCVLMAFPFVWMLGTSIKPQAESLTYPPTLFPLKPTLQYFQTLFTDLLRDIGQA